MGIGLLAPRFPVARSCNGSQREGRIVSLAQELVLDADAAIARITDALRIQVGETLGRRGIVLGMSGGVDSSVCAALAARALGPDRVLGLLMPERESDREDTRLASQLAQQLGIESLVDDITGTLESSGAYRRRDHAIRMLIPEYSNDWKCKITLGSDRFTRNQLSVFFLTVQDPIGVSQKVRLTPVAYREIVAATNFKQRVRKMLEYYHADRLHYAVLGTPNRLEYDQGFFVKGGDGLADVKPIAHLYKTQIYQLARALRIPDAITSRAPTTGTYSLEQGQDEFYFTLPVPLMDRALYAHDHHLGAPALARDLGIPVEAAASALRDIERKRHAARYHHMPALLVDPVEASS